VPVVVATVQAAGVSHVLAAGAVTVNIDSQGMGVQWSETSNATDFAQNLIRARCEGRYATSVFAPAGVVVGDLTA
jgi:hypothetical protein